MRLCLARLEALLRRIKLQGSPPILQCAEAALLVFHAALSRKGLHLRVFRFCAILYKVLHAALLSGDLLRREIARIPEIY